MATLYFKIGADYENVIRLRDEIKKLENQLRSFGKSTPETQIRQTEERLASTRQEFMRLTTEAAKAGAAMENDFKKKIFDASQVVNDFSSQITKQRGVIHQLQSDLSRIKDRYRETAKSGGDASELSEQIKAASSRLREQKDVLFNLTQEQANARLSVKKLRDEYALFKKDGGETEDVINKITGSMRNWAVTIAGGMGLKEFIGQVINVRGEMQQLNAAFTTLLGSSERADALMSQLIETAATTPFNLTDVANGARQLLAYGLEAEEVNETLIRLGDIAAGLSIPLNDLAWLYGTTMTQGRMYAQDLNQFLGRGIPMLDELAKVMGVAKDEVRELVSAGKVGFPEVQEAIENLTGEGSQFGGLMEMQSKTITGQISNIEDSIVQMFNEIGQQSEGVINSALGVVSSLVENWRTVGSAIVAVATGYGVYKAALVTVNAVQKINNMLMQEAAMQQKLAAMQGIALGNAQAMAAARTTLLSAAMKSLRTAIMSNPIGLMATAVAALVAGLMSMKTATEEASAAQKTLAEINGKAAAAVEEEKVRLETLNGILHDNAKSYDERRDALDSIKSVVKDYHADLTAEGTLINDNTEAINKYVEAQMRAAKVEAFKSGLGTSFGKVAEAAAKVKQDFDSVSLLGVNVTSEKDRERNSKWLEDFLKDPMKYTQTGDDGSLRVQIMGSYYTKDLADDNENARALYEAMEEYSTINNMYKKILEEDNSTSNEPLSAPQTYRKALEDAKKEYDAARKAVDEIKQSATATEKDYLDAKKRLEEAEKKYKALSVESNGNGTGGTAGREAERRLDAEKRLGEQLVALRRDNDEAEVEAMQEGLQKRLAQIELNYKREKEAIANQAASFKAGNEATGATALGDDGLTAEQRTELSTWQTRADEQRRQATEAAYRAELDAMRENLKQYGNYQQQKLAIAQEYADKIAAASTEEERRRLSVERDSTLAGIEANELKTNIDWQVVFGGFGSMFEGIIRPILDDTRRYMQTDEFKNADHASQQALVEAVGQMEQSLGGAGKISFKQLGREIDEWRKAMMRLRTAQTSYQASYAELEEAQRNYVKAMAGGTDAEKTAAKEELETAQRNVEVNEACMNQMQEVADNYKDKVTNTATGMKASMDGVIGGLQKITSGSLGGIYNGLIEMGDSLRGQDDKFSKAFAAVSETLKNVPIIGWIVSIIDVFKDGLSVVVGGILDAVFDAVSGIIGDVFSGDLFKTLASSIGSGLQDIFDALSFGGFSKLFGLNGNEEEVKESIDSLTERNASLQSSIDDLTETIESWRGAQSLEAYERAVKMQQEANQNDLDIAKAQAGYYSAHHSWNYYWDTEGGFTQQQIDDFGKQIGRDWDGDIWNLSPEEMKQLRANVDMWEQIRNTGEGNYGERLIEKLDDYIDNAGAVDELTDAINQSLTGITFDSLYDSFIDTLMDMDASAEDFSANFSQYMMRAMLSNKIGELMYDDIEAWYNDFAERSKDGLDERDIEALRSRWDSLAEKGLALRDDLAAATGYDEASAKEQQTASRGGFETMSQDQASELSGRFTAVAETGVRIEGAITSLKGDLSGLLAQSQGIYNIADDTRNILAQSYLELQQINENTGTSAGYLKSIKEDMAIVKQNTSKL